MMLLSVSEHQSMPKTFLRLLNFLIVLKSSESSCADKWPRCNKIRNIACDIGGTCGPKRSCTILAHDETFRREVLDAHNLWRSNVAVGNETKGGNGEAANMMALSYDVQLEFTARCNLVYCKMKHDKCRRTPKWPAAGQNLCKMMGNIKGRTRKCVKNWYDEVKDTTTEHIDKFGSIAGTGHYTQLVWAVTTHIGCARAVDGSVWLLACNYGEAGNIKTKPTYLRGKGCSQCSVGKECNAKYTGLCGEIDEAALKAAPLDGHRLSCSVLVSFLFPFLLLLR